MGVIHSSTITPAYVVPGGGVDVSDQAASASTPSMQRRNLRAMSASPPRNVWRTRRALYSTLALVVWFPGCLLAAWWQVHIALAGDSLGWVYSIEWPVFACFGAYFWWFLVHDDPNDVGRRKLLRLKASGAYEEQIDPAQVRVLDQEDEELRAYNDYLESLKIASADKSFHLRRGAKSRS